MYTLFDNLTATVLSGTILLLLLAMQMSASELSVQQTATYMSKKHSLSFADWLEDDLLKIGRNLPSDGDRAFENPEVGGEGRTWVFEFRRDSLLGDDHPGEKLHIRTRYVLGDDNGVKKQPADVRVVEDGSNVKLYRVTRVWRTWVDDEPEPSGWTATGQSPALLEHFQILMLDRDGESVSDPAGKEENDPGYIQQTRVQFALVPPFDNGDYGDVRSMHWGASLLLRY